MRISVVPAVIITALCIGGVVYALAGNVSASTVRVILAGVVGGVVLMLVAAIFAASTAASQVTTQVRATRAAAQRGQAELQRMVERILRGEQPAPVVPAPSPVMNQDPFELLIHDVEQAQHLAGQGIIRIANRAVGGRADQRVEILVNLARRMQSLVHREIELLDDLEAKVEDPELLKGLFTVDHLATRMRRQSESLAVLGGSASRRQWTRQVTMHEVLRAAIAEVEHYSRVKVVPPVEGTLRGAAVADVIHLVAELVENATKFSPPRTQALLRAQVVAAGVAIEVEDRGLGMMPSDQQRMNALLADPGEIDIDELLRDGRIGLYVVSTLARRHGVRVQIQGNIYGGTSAVIVLPKALLEVTGESEVRQGAFADSQGEHELVPLGSPAGPRPATMPQPVAVPRPATMPQPIAMPQTAVPQPATVPPAAVPPATMPPAAVPPATMPPTTMPRSTTMPQPAAVPRSAWSAGVDSDQGTGGQISLPPPTPYDMPSPAREFTQPQAAVSREERPPLPKRQAQAHLAPPLREQPNGAGNGAAEHREPPADQMPGLMADFLKGVSRSEEEDFPARD
jgi:signal transduction histidine kinase